MKTSRIEPKLYTPEQVAQMLQVKRNTVYQLIARGEIIAKKIGSGYRIPASSLSFVFSGLDFDLAQAEQRDLLELPKIHNAIKRVKGK